MKPKLQRIIFSNAVIAAVLAFIAVAAFSGGVSGSAFAPENEEAIYSGNPAKGEVSFMVNVYWGTEFLPDMLETFEEYGVKTTFFVGGSWAKNNPDMLKKIAVAGHEIGNHGYNHKGHDKLDEAGNRDEIEKCAQTVKDIAGVKLNLFAPPSGAFSKTTVKVAAGLGYKTIMWSKDTIDWRDKNTVTIFERATKNLKAGDLILAHPTKNTAEALPQILKFYKNTGFLCVTVSQNLS